MRHLILIVLLGLFTTVLKGSDPYAPPANPLIVTVRFPTADARMEVAMTPFQRRKGLSFRQFLPAGHGMLFVFEQPFRLTFSMRDTVVPLSIAFVSADCRIINIEQMPVDSTKIHSSSAAARFAVEMSLGWFVDNGVRPGDSFLWSTNPHEQAIDGPCRNIE